METKVNHVPLVTGLYTPEVTRKIVEHRKDKENKDA